MHKIAVLGEKDVVIGFSALGLKVFPVTPGEEALKTLIELTKNKDEYSIIYVTESCARGLASEIVKYDESPSPAVILIPGPGGSTGISLSAIDAAVERAIGANIL